MKDALVFTYSKDYIRKRGIYESFPPFASVKGKRMKTKKPALWSLEKLHPHMGGLPKVLPVWFKHSKLLKMHYSKAKEKAKGISSSGRLNPKQKVHLTASLLSVRAAIHNALLKGCEKAYGSAYPALGQSSLRWILRCRPSGGKWVGDKKTWYCRNVFCPWCWMRRHDLIYRGLQGKQGEKITYAGKSIRGIDMKGRLHCLSFRATGARFFNSSAFLNELLKLATQEIIPARRTQPLLRVCYPMPDLMGATIAYLSNRPFENMTSGTTDFPALEDGKLGIHVTANPLPLSRLLATRMLWAPEMLSDPKAADRVIDIFRGKNLVTTSLEK